MTILPPLRFTNARLLVDGALTPGALSVEQGRIGTATALPALDLSGYLVLPGIVDLHGTAFEHHLAPRPDAPLPIGPALAATERDAAAHGVTTAWMAQGWSWAGGLHGADAAEALLAELDSYRAQALIDLRPQIVLETHLPDSRARLLAAVERHRVDFVLLRNQLPEILAQAARAEQEGRPAQALAQTIEAARRRSGDVPRHLLALAKAFDRLGVCYGSYADPDADNRERFRILGAHIAAFPLSFNAAAAAQAMGDPVIMGAPNVLRGGGVAGGISASSLIARGYCDVLVSDDHYPSLAKAAWLLADTGVQPFARAWAMISDRPARLLGLSDRGRIAPGLRADLVLVDAETRRIEATISAGRIAQLSGRLADRLSGPGLPLAAE